MATLTYTFVDRCAGGGHTTIGVTLNALPTQNVVYTTDDIRASLASLTQDEREAAALIILKLHCAGKTRAQLVTEFGAGPVTVTL